MDDVLSELDISRVDFIKLDVEGAELSVLQGAWQLLQSPYRPVILAEVQDTRTLPWGYPAGDIIQFLARIDYKWFALAPDNSLRPVSCGKDSYDANLVAVPVERKQEFAGMLADDALGELHLHRIYLLEQPQRSSADGNGNAPSRN